MEKHPASLPLLHSHLPSGRDEIVMVMATLTRPTAACTLCEEVRCAEDGVGGVERVREERRGEGGREG